MKTYFVKFYTHDELICASGLKDLKSYLKVKYDFNDVIFIAEIMYEREIDLL